MLPTPESSPKSAPLASPSWNARAIVLFAIILAILAGIGAANWFYRPAPPTGLPADPAVAAAVAALGGTLEVATGELRFVSSFGEGEMSGAPLDSARAAALTQAAYQLELGRARHRFDPRFDCLLGHVDLAADRLERAERRYRAALSLTPRYGEARLGLGVALARRATAEGDAPSARALRLEAIAQFAAVDESDSFYLPALFDRVLLLIDVGRSDEAQRLAERYQQLDPGSVWTGVLRRRFDRG